MIAIAAADKNWAIGHKGRLLVSIPADMKNFRALTSGKVIIYGRKTLETFPQQVVLPNRVNIVLSANPEYTVKNARMARSIEELQEMVREYDPEDLCVIGGAKVYEELLPLCDTCIITRLDREYEADKYFPNLEKLEDWELAEESDEQYYFDTTYTFQTWKRRNA